MPALRGISPDIFIIDEAAFIEGELFTKIVFPVIANVNRFMLAISTPDDQGNHYSRILMTKKKDGSGRLLFPCVSAEQACESCVALGKGSDCHHRDWMMPWWRTQKGLDIQRMFQSDDVYAAEAQGRIVDRNKHAFKASEVDRVFAENGPKGYPRTMGVVFVAIDPSWGSLDKGRMAILSFTFTDDGYVLVSSAPLGTSP